jgi:predicted GNAT family acetyltransferase
MDGNLIGVLDYAVNGDSISFTRSFTNPQYRGNGYAGELVEFAANDVESSGTRRIVPMCWYVGDWFAAHPERAGLLSR